MGRIFLIQIFLISFLDSVCTGLMLPVLNSYILTILHGSHKITGFLVSLNLIARIVAKPVVNHTFKKYGAQKILTLTFLMSLCTNLITASATFYPKMVFCRCIHFLTNQTQIIVKAIINDSEPSEKQEHVNKKKDVINLLGLMFGSILGGNLYENNNCFHCVTDVILIIICMNIAISICLPKNETVAVASTSLIHKLQDETNFAKESLKRFNMKRYGVILTIRFLTTMGLLAFFLKFSQLLRANLHASIHLVGYVIAYQNMFLFIAYSVVIYYIPRMDVSRCLKKVLRASIALLILFLYTICNTFNYVTYLVVYFPLAILRAFFEKFWDNFYENDDMKRCIDSVIKIFDILTPLIFGFFCDIYGVLAIKTFAIFPPILALILCIFCKYEERKIKLQ